MRSGVANCARASTQIVRQPSCLAAAQSASAVSTAPTTTSRGGGPYTSANTRIPPWPTRPFRGTRGRAPPTDRGREPRKRRGRVTQRLLAFQEHEELRPRRRAFEHREEHRTFVRVREREEPLGQVHSKRSTKTSISPPHGRPMPSASSSEIP